MRKFWIGSGLAIASSAAALAQDTTTNTGLLGSLGSIGAVGLVALAVVAFFVWQWFFSSGD